MPAPHRAGIRFSQYDGLILSLPTQPETREVDKRQCLADLAGRLPG
jgi:hypothetical protein